MAGEQQMCLTARKLQQFVLWQHHGIQGHCMALRMMPAWPEAQGSREPGVLGIPAPAILAMSLLIDHRQENALQHWKLFTIQLRVG
jgi:hypothetical protein